MNSQEKNLKHVAYDSVRQVIDTLLLNSEFPHPEYESVKLYGDADLIIDALCAIFRDYPNLDIALIDIIASGVDHATNDEYVLAIYGKEVYVQSAWNGLEPFRNEAKFAICQSGISPKIIEQILSEETEAEIATIKLF